MKYIVRTSKFPSGKFHWELYEHIPPDRVKAVNEKLLEQCCTQDDFAACPCDGFDSEEAAKKDGEDRKRELNAQK